MLARTLDELVVYRKSLAACAAVSELLERQKVRTDCDLRAQLAAASGGVPANIAEGFGQQSDRQFAKYLFIARGSAHEVRAHLAVAHGRRYLDNTELSELSRKYEEIARMLTGLIKYLRASDRKQRG
ncbi:MAG TPA: four helix bundle protein [Vicinamibacterales bacterium]|nr:four helix bundle protein [Vicinamibacterales bacterium]